MDDFLNQQESLLVQMELLRKKQFRFHEALIVEYDVGAKFKIERELESLDTEQKRVAQLLSKVENKIEDIVRTNAKNNSEEENKKLEKSTQVLEIADKDYEETGDTIFEIIGFDLGHGETAISRTTSHTSLPPQKLDLIDGRSSILTAISLDATRGILIGDDAYCHRNNESLEIFFKSPYLSIPENSESLKLFVYKCFKLLSSSGKINNDKNTNVYVGVPSGWTLDDREEYESILKDAGLRNVTVIPESRAAFLEAKESGALHETASKLIDSVLIIDIGSSTTDFTIVKSYEEKPLDFGYNKLGSGLIDLSIFNLTLNKYANIDDSFNHIFDENSEIKSRCLLKCRQVKEKYFSKNDESFWIDRPCAESERVLGVHHFDIDIYKSDMDEILSSPIDDLDGQSWPDAFRNALSECKEYVEYEKPNLVMLTGGGSRMNFIYEICKEMFPGSLVKVGLEPHLTISRGLSIAGRTDFKVNAFRHEIEAFLSSESLEKVVEDEFSSLYSSVAKSLFDQCVEVSLDSFQKWSSGELSTLRNMEEEIISTVDVLVREKGELIFLDDIVQWVESLVQKIDVLTSDICKKYSIPKKYLSIPITPSAVELDGKSFEDVIKPGSSVTGAAGSIVGWLAGIVSGGLLVAVGVMLTGGIAGALYEVVSWIVSIVAGLGAASAGIFTGVKLTGSLDRKIRDSVVPVPLRKKMISTAGVVKMLEKQRTDIEKDLFQAIEKDFSSTNKKVEVLNALREKIIERA